MTKEQALLKRPRLLAQTHIDERGSALATEREALTGERAGKIARALEVHRLIAIWEWLPVAENDITESYAAIEHLHVLERRRDEAEGRLVALEREAEIIRPRAESAREAVRREQRLREIRAELELRLAELQAQLERERPLAAVAAAEAANLDSSREEAEAVLAQAVEASGLVRRWRGLPKPEDQEHLIESLRGRYELSSQTEGMHAATIEALEAEAAECMAVIRSLPALITPQLQHEKKREREQRKVTPLVVQTFAAGLTADGRGDSATRKILTILQGVLQRAVEWQRIAINPVSAVRKPSAKPKSKPEPIVPTGVEAIRRAMSERDAVLVSVMAYAGLRPGEALALTWGDIRKRTIVVNKAVSLGEEKDTKTGKERSVPLRKALAQDLRKWKLKSGRPSDDQLVFPAKAGGLWQDHDYRDWRKRSFTTAVEAAGVACPRPYDLRHCCASLRFAEGANPAEIANEMGHSLETLLRTYTHVIKDLAGQGVVSGDDLIRQARRVHILVTRAAAIGR